ncbi:Malonyl CoA-acyl carrier protein transacylase [Paraburkholderia ribeironis]|uniref:Malonyl CoA-acyl carrier protein transacylase n=1 Tax=Paraburkholderia ribeironis TaxID=1247936 RepID=A0A1N7S6Z0_9BURK|nr:ACP S-malonyltransferase [Paraburkholderia ribeironis]SIT43197.1 Malonyl CoA-acyl carrier protein transacylase [Paraburkholderia ribeironis]
MSDNAQTTAWLFPGQGSQVVGMGRDLLASYAPAREVLAVASEMAGVDLDRIIARGPDALLTRTDNLQPALTAINLGCCLLLKESGIPVHVVAGHSLGEFSALYAAGVLNLDDVLRLVVTRARLMHEVSSTLDGGMLAIKGIADDVIKAVVAQVAVSHVVGIANYNTATQTVLSGERDGLAQIASTLEGQDGQVIPLNVSGPWHSPLLASAAERFVEALRGAQFHDASVPVILNVTGAATKNAAEIREKMEIQLCSPVQWKTVQYTLVDSGVKRIIEVGPGKVLRGLSRGIPELAGCEVVNVDGPRSLRFLSASPDKAVV